MGKNDDKNAQRSVKTHCGQWVCGHCDCLGISLIFRLTTFDVRIRRQKSSNSANRVFYISLNKGYFGKAIFSRLFSARYHILALYRDMPVRVYNDRPASDVSVQFNHGILPCPAGVVELEVVFLTTCHVTTVRPVWAFVHPMKWQRY